MVDNQQADIAIEVYTRDIIRCYVLHRLKTVKSYSGVAYRNNTSMFDRFLKKNQCIACHTQVSYYKILSEIMLLQISKQDKKYIQQTSTAFVGVRRELAREALVGTFKECIFVKPLTWFRVVAMMEVLAAIIAADGTHLILVNDLSEHFDKLLIPAHNKTVNQVLSENGGWMNLLATSVPKCSSVFDDLPLRENSPISNKSDRGVRSATPMQSEELFRSNTSPHLTPSSESSTGGVLLDNNCRCGKEKPITQKKYMRCPNCKHFICTFPYCKVSFRNRVGMPNHMATSHNNEEHPYKDKISHCICGEIKVILDEETIQTCSNMKCQHVWCPVKGCGKTAKTATSIVQHMRGHDRERKSNKETAKSGFEDESKFVKVEKCLGQHLKPHKLPNKSAAKCQHCRYYLCMLDCSFASKHMCDVHYHQETDHTY